MIRNVTNSDASSIAQIYNHYVDNTTITFEEEPVKPDDIQQRMTAVKMLNLPWLVIEDHSEVVGYAYATQWKTRSAYRFTVESTVYIAPRVQRKGYGLALYSALFAQLASTEIRSIIGVITLPNEASVALHEKMGMHKVAHFESVGFKFGEWQDVGYWQIQLIK